MYLVRKIRRLLIQEIKMSPSSGIERHVQSYKTYICNI